MAKKRGCCGCITTLLVAFILIVGGVIGVYCFTSPSTFGLTSIGDFELGELSDCKWKDIVGDFKDLTSSPDEEDVVEVTYGNEQKTESKDNWGDSTTPADDSVLGQITNNASPENEVEKVTDVIMKPVVTVTPVQLDFAGNDFVYLFNQVIAEIEDGNADYDDLEDLIDTFGDGTNTPIEIKQILLKNEGGVASVNAVVLIDISKFKQDIDTALEAIPSFLRPTIDNKMYFTAYSEVVVANDGTLTAKEGTSTLKVNTLDDKTSELILGVLVEAIGEPDMSAENISSVIIDAFGHVVNNLGGVGTLDDGTANYGANAIKTADAAKGGALSVVTNTAD